MTHQSLFIGMVVAGASYAFRRGLWACLRGLFK
jgi:hypothetical protein